MVSSSFHDKADDAVSSVRQAASSGMDEVNSRVVAAGGDTADFAKTQENRAATGLHSLAGAADAAVDRLAPDLPSTAKAVHAAASGVDQASRDLHAQSAEDLGAGLARFARAQPVAALTTAFVAGILLSRTFTAR